MILNCIIIDDEPLALELLHSYIEKTPFLNLKGKYSNAISAMKDLVGMNSIHLVFLDIQMPGLTGLEFSKLIDSHIRVIFTTAFEQYALDSYKVNALDYLLKPISFTDFMKSVSKAINWFELYEKQQAIDVSADKDYVYVKSDYKLAVKELISKNIKVDLVFLDPPFRMKVIDELCDYLIKNDMIEDGGYIVAEYPKEDIVNKDYPGFRVKLCRRYSSSEVIILEKED